MTQVVDKIQPARSEDRAHRTWMTMLDGRPQGPVEWETDRARFLGRGRGPEDPQALDGRPLTGTTGALLDPIVSLRQRVRLAPGAVVRLSLATGVATSRETALALAQRYCDPSATSRTFAPKWSMTPTPTFVRKWVVAKYSCVRKLGAFHFTPSEIDGSTARPLQPGWP